MYTRATLPTPVRMIPLTIFVLLIVAGFVISQFMLGIDLPPLSVPEAPAAVAAVEAAPGETAVPPAQAVPPVTAISPVFTPEVRYWNDDIIRWSNQYGLDANLVATVMQIESCGNPAAVSSSGAQGLFQVMPFHFVDGENMTDPDTNAARGLAYLSNGLALASNEPGLALAGYNGGHSQIGKTWSLWPNETQRYYYWGSGIYGDVNAGNDTSGRLTEWLNAGGASLCAKAHEQLGLQ